MLCRSILLGALLVSVGVSAEPEVRSYGSTAEIEEMLTKWKPPKTVATPKKELRAAPRTIEGVWDIGMLFEHRRLTIRKTGEGTYSVGLHLT